MLTSNWGLDAIDVHQVWSQGHTGEGVVVAVIDAGIELHPDLTPNLWTNTAERINRIDDDGNGYVDDMNGWDFAESDNVPLTTNKHGNHVSGIVGAVNDGVGATGVAYGAKIMPLRVFDDDNSSSSREIADAIRYAVDNGADVINLSLDSVSTRNVTAALQYAGTNGVLVVASSGNRASQTPSYPATSSATLDNVISVGAHNANYEVWAGSNRVGPSGAVQVDAPGVSIFSTSIDKGYVSSSGTSAAAAHVAGIAALALSANSSLTPKQLRTAIVNGASRSVFGSDALGAVNAARTLSLVVSPGQQVVQGTVFAGDFNGDGEVGFSDFVSLARNFGRESATREQGDANGNGRVDFGDFLMFSRDFQLSLGTRASAAAAISPNGSGEDLGEYSELQTDLVERIFAAIGSLN